MDFSIIVPVFNAENHIEKCIYSLLNQKFNGTFEVIAVDDASTDKSLSILKEIRVKDSRISILQHKVNKKQVVARATGMKAAKGNYILNVDADDFLLPDALECLSKIINEFNPDVVVVDSYLEFNDGRRELKKFVDSERFTVNKISIQNSFYYHLGTKIFKRSIINNLITGKEIIITNADDILYCFEIFLKAKSFYLLPKAFYIGCIHSNSLTRVTKPFEKLNSLSEVIRCLSLIIRKQKPEDALIYNLLKYLEMAFYDFSLLTWFSNSMNQINIEKLLISYREFPKISDKQIRSYKLALTKNYYAFYYSLMNLGFSNTLIRILKYYCHKYII